MNAFIYVSSVVSIRRGCAGFHFDAALTAAKQVRNKYQMKYFWQENIICTKLDEQQKNGRRRS